MLSLSESSMNQLNPSVNKIHSLFLLTFFQPTYDPFFAFSSVTFEKFVTGCLDFRLLMKYITESVVKLSKISAYL